MKRLTFFIFAGIIFLGGILRFWQLANHPVSLSIDEVAIGYNAYSILKTARDEHGQFLPIAFRSIGDYKPPVLIYLTVPAIRLFGLNEFGVRFTLALIGTLTIAFVYLLTRELIRNETASLITSFSLAISPWHLQFSRATFEAILALFFAIVGTWLFLRAARTQGKSLWLSAIFFSLAMYSYHAERLFVPIFVAGLALFFRKELLRNKKATIFAILVGILISLPLLSLLLGTQGQARLASVFISKDYLINAQLHQKGEELTLLQRIFDSNLLILGNFWLKRYLDYWDLSFLFLSGTQLTLPGAPDVGLFHFFEAIPFLVGIWLVFFTKNLDKRQKGIIGFWLLTGPLAASLANNPQHPLRSLCVIPVPQILVGLGGFWLFEQLRRRKLATKVIIGLVITVLIITSLVYYGDIYYVHFPIHFSEYWSYGMKDLALYAWGYRSDYKEIVIDPTFGTREPYTVGVPYLYVLFYGQYDPWLFQNDPRRTGKWDSFDFTNFSFRSIYWPNDRYREKTLFIGSPWALPREDIHSEQIKREIKFKNVITGFLIVEATRSAEQRKNGKI
jgi:4-amino-4-deoxy-L-arabinose transferase-like glycosyltransferase